MQTWPWWLGVQASPGRGLVSELAELRKAANFWARGEPHGGGGEARLHGGACASGGCRPGRKCRGGQGLGRSPETSAWRGARAREGGRGSPSGDSVWNFKLPPGPTEQGASPRGRGTRKGTSGFLLEGKTISSRKAGVGFPGGPGSKKSACSADAFFNPWKIPWRGGWFPTPAFFPGESHGQRSLADYSPEVTQSDITE